MIYVAFLRGINVGGNSKVAMPQLKKTFENLGFENVITYINSGNVIFSDNRNQKIVLPLIEKAIFKDFGLKIRVVLRNKTNIHKLCQEIPPSWTNDTLQKTDVLFLLEEIDAPSIVNKVVHNPIIETVSYIDGTLVWNIDRKNITKGNGIKLIKTDLYKYMTIRNVNTVRKLNALMEKLDS